MIERLPVDRDLQHVRVGPVGLDALAWLVYLREEHLLRRPMSPQPLNNPPLERAQGSPVRLAWMGGEQMLEKSFRFHFRALLEPTLGLGPDPDRKSTRLNSS